MIGPDLVAYLQDLFAPLDGTPNAVSVHQNRVPQTIRPPYVFVRRSNVTHAEEAIDEPSGQGPWESAFDVEVYAGDLDQLDAIADLLHTAHGHDGSFGAGTVQDLIVADHDESYVGSLQSDDDEEETAALLLEIIGYAPAP